MSYFVAEMKIFQKSTEDFLKNFPEAYLYFKLSKFDMNFISNIIFPMFSVNFQVFQNLSKHLFKISQKNKIIFMDFVENIFPCLY